MKYKHLLLLICLVSVALAQTPFSKPDIKQFNNNIKAKKDTVYNIKEYKYFKVDIDTMVVDTTLNINKHHKMNFLRKDMFGYQSFANVGSRYNPMKFVPELSTIPELAASSKRMKYQSIDDVFYYDVKTPFTELFYLEGLKEGQAAGALITVNVLPEWNIAIKYSGVRSLGTYIYSLSDASHFTFSSYANLKRYSIKAHFTYQKLFNRENGGLKEPKKEFESGDSKFLDRVSVKVNLDRDSKVETFLKGKQYYLGQLYQLNNDSLHKFNIGYDLKFETKHYKYYDDNSKQTKDIYESEATREGGFDSINFQIYENDIFVQLYKSKVYNYRLGVAYQELEYNLDSLDTEKIKTEMLKLKAVSNFNFKGLKFDMRANYNVNGLYKDAFYIDAKINYPIRYIGNIFIKALSYRRAPAFNAQNYRSNYKRYRWNNDFKDELVQRYGFELNTPYGVVLDASYNTLNNYVYWNKDRKPQQHTDEIRILEAKLSLKLDIWKISLNNTVQYQSIIQGEEVYRLPHFLGRSELYYTDYWFDKAMFVQTGFSVKYFSAYKSNAFFPLLNEYYLQDKQEIGNYPMFDVFFNAKVKTMRMYFIVENLTSFTDDIMRSWFSKHNTVPFNYYSAPNYPFRDWGIRMGIVWNFFS